MIKRKQFYPLTHQLISSGQLCRVVSFCRGGRADIQTATGQRIEIDRLDLASLREFNGVPFLNSVGLKAA